MRQVILALVLTKREHSSASATKAATNLRKDMRKWIDTFNSIILLVVYFEGAFEEEVSYNLAFCFGCTKVQGIRVNNVCLVSYLISDFHIWILYLGVLPSNQEVVQQCP